MISAAVRRVTADDITAVLLLAGLASAVSARVLLAGVDGPRSLAGGVVFALAMFALAAAGGGLSDDHLVSSRSVAWGLAVGALLCAAPVLHRLHPSGSGHGFGFATSQGFAVWAGVVTVVAVAEEALLRGALFAAVRRQHGDGCAVAVTAVAFAALHVPVYGWSVVGLDLAVGVVLGTVRVLAGSVTAPAIAHVGADLAGWWLR